MIIKYNIIVRLVLLIFPRVFTVKSGDPSNNPFFSMAYINSSTPSHTVTPLLPAVYITLILLKLHTVRVIITIQRKKTA